MAIGIFKSVAIHETVVLGLPMGSAAVFHC
jgi:hypothetical protein